MLHSGPKSLNRAQKAILYIYIYIFVLYNRYIHIYRERWMYVYLCVYVYVYLYTGVQVIPFSESLHDLVRARRGLPGCRGGGRTPAGLSF